MFSAIVVDDEWAVGELLGVQLEATHQFEVKTILQNPYELIDSFVLQPVDIVFLDISMPEISGIALAEQLSQLEHPPEIIFVTAYNDYAIEAFRVNALDYLVKPVQERELQRVIHKLSKRISMNKENNETIRYTLENNIVSNIQLLTKLKFPTAKCEELLFYMLLKEGQPISKWRLIEDLWPEKEKNKGETNLRTTVFRLNQTISQENLSIRIKSAKGGYYIIQLSSSDEPSPVSFFPDIALLRVHQSELGRV